MVSGWPERAKDLVGTTYLVLPPLPNGLEYELIKEQDSEHLGVMIVRSESEPESSSDNSPRE